MQILRPYVLTIAGFDPSAGAGVLADCKTFEQHAVYGFAACSALTVQSDDRFLSIKWLSAEEIIEQLQPLMSKFVIAACKIGVINSPETLLQVIRFLREYNPVMRIVWDPVLKASAGFEFHEVNTFHKLEEVLTEITLLTPNYHELQQLQTITGEELIRADHAVFCPVLLKGGHRPDALGTDTLYEPGGMTIIKPGVNKVTPKHGSGCVLAAAITARLATGLNLKKACAMGKQYVETFLNSNPTLLGYHTP